MMCKCLLVSEKLITIILAIELSLSNALELNDSSVSTFGDKIAVINLTGFGVLPLSMATIVFRSPGSDGERKHVNCQLTSAVATAPTASCCRFGAGHRLDIETPLTAQRPHGSLAADRFPHTTGRHSCERDAC